METVEIREYYRYASLVQRDVRQWLKNLKIRLTKKEKTAGRVALQAALKRQPASDRTCV
jgi:hypothetical protein